MIASTRILSFTAFLSFTIAMKQTLLFLGLLGFAGTVQAQVSGLGPWVEVNTTNFATKPPGYIIRDIKTVAPNVA